MIMIIKVILEAGFQTRFEFLFRSESRLTSLSVSLSLSLSIYIYTICVYVCMYVYIYIYTHTYTYNVCVCIYIYIYIPMRREVPAPSQQAGDASIFCTLDPRTCWKEEELDLDAVRQNKTILVRNTVRAT